MAASAANISMSPSSSLFRSEMILETEEDFGRQILLLLSAERAGDRDRLERNLRDS